MSKCWVCRVRNSRLPFCTLFRPKYCAPAVDGRTNKVVVARHTSTDAHRNMGPPELVVGGATLSRDRGAVDRRHGEVSVAEALCEIKTQRARVSRIRTA